MEGTHNYIHHIRVHTHGGEIIKWPVNAHRAFEQCCGKPRLRSDSIHSHPEYLSKNTLSLLFTWWFVGVWSLTRLVMLVFFASGYRTTVDENAAREKKSTTRPKSYPKSNPISTRWMWQTRCYSNAINLTPISLVAGVGGKMSVGKVVKLGGKSIQFPIPSHKICL